MKISCYHFATSRTKKKCFPSFGLMLSRQILFLRYFPQTLQKLWQPLKPQISWWSCRTQVWNCGFTALNSSLHFLFFFFSINLCWAQRGFPNMQRIINGLLCAKNSVGKKHIWTIMQHANNKYSCHNTINVKDYQFSISLTGGSSIHTCPRTSTRIV